MGIFGQNWWHFPFGCHSAIKMRALKIASVIRATRFSNRFGGIPLFSLWLSFTRRGVKVYFNLISLFAVICRHLMAGMNMNWIGCDGGIFRLGTGLVVYGLFWSPMTFVSLRFNNSISTEIQENLMARMAGLSQWHGFLISF